MLCLTTAGEMVEGRGSLAGREIAHEKEIPVRVALVLSEHKVVINKGALDGVKKNDRFLVFRYGEIVRDPVTDEPLEELEHIAGVGRAVHVQKRIATLVSAEPFYDTKRGDCAIIYISEEKQTKQMKEAKRWQTR